VLEKKPNILLDINQIPVDGNDQKLYKKTDQPAKPLMGIDNLYKYLRYNIQLPPEARTHGIRRGKVRVSFVIEKDGKISNIQILKGMGGGYDQEALRLVKGFPRFVPAIHQGKRVRVQKKIPIVFQ
jgi:protein TonB